MQSYFIWNGTDSRSMGITTRRAAPLIRPEERVQHVSIPGRSGDLTEIEGKHIYNSYIQTVDFTVNTAAQVRSVFRWLRGEGYVTFSSDPDKEQEARIIGAVTLDKVSRNLDKWAGTVQFYCQPLKQRIYSIAETLTVAGTIRNNGDVASKPLIKLTPSAYDVELIVGDKTLAISGFMYPMLIDCEAQEISNLDKTVLGTEYSSGDFPVLGMGNNEISGSGWSKLEIYKNERFL